MRIKATDFASGGYFHIYNHPAQRIKLFREFADYEKLLEEHT